MCGGFNCCVLFRSPFSGCPSPRECHLPLAVDDQQIHHRHHGDDLKNNRRPTKQSVKCYPACSHSPLGHDCLLLGFNWPGAFQTETEMDSGVLYIERIAPRRKSPGILGKYFLYVICIYAWDVIKETKFEAFLFSDLKSVEKHEMK